MASTVLIVDDTESMQNVISKALKSQGYNILLAAHGSEALEILDESSESIDLILSDYNMPIMNGLTLLKNVRNNSNPNIANKPFIILTTENSYDKRKEAKDLGLSSWVVKPYKYKAFLAEINYAINNRG